MFFLFVFGKIKLQKVFEDLFLDNKVDLVLAGHVHSYERLFPTAHNKPVQKHYHAPPVPTYVVVGNAGNIEGITEFQEDYAPWTAYRYSSYGYAHMQINRTAIEWRFHGSDDMDKILDQFTLTK